MGMRPARMQRRRGGERARVSHRQGLPDLEVKVDARLSIVCVQECWGMPSARSDMGLGLPVELRPMSGWSPSLAKRSGGIHAGSSKLVARRA